MKGNKMVLDHHSAVIHQRMPHISSQQFFSAFDLVQRELLLNKVSLIDDLKKQITLIIGMYPALNILYCTPPDCCSLNYTGYHQDCALCS